MALSCKLTRDLLRTTSCGYSLPKVTDIYLANYNDVLTNIGEDSGGCETVTAITSAATATEDVHFYHIEPAKDSVTFTDELVVEDNGNKYRTHTLTFGYNAQYDGCLHIDFDNLSLGRYIGVVKTADGKYLMLGRTAGLEASEATLSGGETNGMTITLSANVAESTIPLADSVISVVTG